MRRKSVTRNFAAGAVANGKRHPFSYWSPPITQPKSSEVRTMGEPKHRQHSRLSNRPTTLWVPKRILQTVKLVIVNYFQYSKCGSYKNNNEDDFCTAGRVRKWWVAKKCFQQDIILSLFLSLYFFTSEKKTSLK